MGNEENRFRIVCPSQNVCPWARDLKFWENLYLPSCVTCPVSHVMFQMSHVTFHVSHVPCHMSHVTFFKSGIAIWWTVCYQRGLPRLVFMVILLSRAHFLFQKKSCSCLLVEWARFFINLKALCDCLHSTNLFFACPCVTMYIFQTRGFKNWSLGFSRVSARQFLQAIPLRKSEPSILRMSLGRVWSLPLDFPQASPQLHPLMFLSPEVW